MIHVTEEGKVPQHSVECPLCATKFTYDHRDVKGAVYSADILIRDGFVKCPICDKSVYAKSNIHTGISIETAAAAINMRPEEMLYAGEAVNFPDLSNHIAELRDKARSAKEARKREKIWANVGWTIFIVFVAIVIFHEAVKVYNQYIWLNK